jgi:hypothetical protein
VSSAAIQSRSRGVGALAALALAMASPPLLQGCDIDRDQGILADAHRQAPVCHGAARLSLGDGAKRFHGLRVEERVQHGDGSIELGLRRRTARDRKVHLPELLFRRRTSAHESSIHPSCKAQHAHHRATSHAKPPSDARCPEACAPTGRVLTAGKPGLPATDLGTSTCSAAAGAGQPLPFIWKGNGA